MMIGNFAHFRKGSLGGGLIDNGNLSPVEPKITNGDKSVPTC